ncbi:MAG: DUF1499 domain-containing protein [Gemmatimonadota bacterium]
MSGFLRGLTENRAQTDPDSEDERLVGRTYAIPFEDVWQSAKALASGGLKGWTLWVADDQEGIMEASTSSFLFFKAADVRIRIGLDENAQTRVDLMTTSRTQRGDLGRSRRTTGLFLTRLDAALQAGPAQILDASGSPAWSEPS